jgi:hypothetical protein
MFKKINDEENIANCEFIISYKRSSPEKFRDEYLDNRSVDKVNTETISEFRKANGIKGLDEFPI